MSAPDVPTPPAPPATPAEVSWQLLFWSFVPLVVNTMSQPCGHFCSVPRRYRTYLRASPLVCLADSISIIIRIAYHFVASFQSKRHGARTYTFKYRLISYLKFRFENVAEADGTDKVIEEFTDDGLKTVERMTWLRWLFFGFGTLGPGFKLLAMKGVPWTKTWGILLIASFIIVEVLIILSWNRKKLEDDFQPTYDWYNPSSSPLQKLDRILFKIACAAHFIVLFWIIAELWPRIESQQTVLQHAFSNPNFGPPARVWGRLVILLIEMMFIALPVFIFYALRSRETFLASFGIRTICLLVMLFSCWIGLYIWVGIVCFIVDVLFLLLLAIPMGYLSIAIDGWVKAFPRLCEALQVTARMGGKQRWTIVKDEKAFGCFVGFLYSVVLSIVWFALRYDRKGTQNPGWTAVFG